MPTKSRKKAPRKAAKKIRIVEEEVIVNAAATAPPSPIDTPDHPAFIRKPKADDTGSTVHHIRASRGEELPFYNRNQIPA